MTRFDGASRKPPGLRAATLITAALVALLAACGGQDQPGGGIASAGDPPPASPAAGVPAPTGRQGGKSAFFDAQLKYVQCMRRSGIEDWPDPKLSGYSDWSKIQVVQARLQSGPNARQGQDKLTEAMRACMPEMQAADALEPQRDAQQEYESMLEHAKCMRNNGVSAFTNPTMQGGQVIPGGDANPTGSSIDQDSPAYKQAREACKDKLLDGLDGMQ
ncbi:hypothetical protein ACH347_42860 [Saccharopolyspora sp. 5N102]|uniref:hypothetical protein n=1 Tax=Saccharopolyspora sp. 5N102 TaxID=3375155 RepID=UPI003798E486